jgi:predicted nucleic acid-binding protein
LRPPSSTLVLDAAIIISAAIGRSSGAIDQARLHVTLVTTDRVLSEAHRRIELGLKRPDLLAPVEELTDAIVVVAVETLEPLLRAAEATLRDGPASRNGSIQDAHVLALAWSANADIWTSDRDFAGTGVATWSTANLMRALTDAPRVGSP